MFSKELISKEDQARIIKSIENAELETSGEIRVHIENSCKSDPIGRAVLIFNKLKMYETGERNGVLIYIAIKSKKFAIIGDNGINVKVPDNFWEDVKERIFTNFRDGNLCEGLCTAIELAGSKLKEFFPRKDDDINEQSNEISFG